MIIKKIKAFPFFQVFMQFIFSIDTLTQENFQELSFL